MKKLTLLIIGILMITLIQGAELNRTDDTIIIKDIELLDVNSFEVSKMTDDGEYCYFTWCGKGGCREEKIPISICNQTDERTLRNQIINDYLEDKINESKEQKVLNERLGKGTITINAPELGIPSNLYKCSTNPTRNETCVCLSPSERTCYYETCGKSPYGRCTFGEWVKI